MALGNNNSAIYLTIADGKIVRRFKEKTPNSKERTLAKGPNAGKVVHEEQYSFVEGMITDIVVRDSDFGKTWNVTIKDGSEQYILQMDYSSGYSSNFLKALPNVDLTHKVKLSPKMTIEGDKKRTTVFINQKGEACKHFYTKENPNGLPPMEQKKIKGKLTWDDSEMMDFLENMVNTKILPILRKGKNTEEVTEEVEAGSGADDVADDLPF